jgi:nucleotide-binding universal stress UspA family protein
MYGEILIADDGHAGGRDGVALAELLRGSDTTLVSAHDLGGGIILGGELFRGYRGFGGEFGHTPAGRAVLDVARSLAWELGAELQAARVVSVSNWVTLDSGGGWKAVAAAQRMREISGVHGVAFEGDVERELVRFARNVDLLVVGTHHHGVARRLMRGDVAAGLTSHSPCPLLVV